MLSQARAEHTIEKITTDGIMMVVNWMSSYFHFEVSTCYYNYKVNGTNTMTPCVPSTEDTIPGWSSLNKRQARCKSDPERLIKSNQSLSSALVWIGSSLKDSGKSVWRHVESSARGICDKFFFFP